MAQHGHLFCEVEHCFLREFLAPPQQAALEDEAAAIPQPAWGNIFNAEGSSPLWVTLLCGFFPMGVQF